MTDLRSLVSKIRSKNAGPFWLTIDIFCGTAEAFDQVSGGLSTSRVAAVFGAEEQSLKRFDIPDLNVVKFSLPRPTVQGAIDDRDMHGASWAALIGEIAL
ncbi:DUF4387 family protein [uncultured Roseobacter sp.]|uniref:DUF4387 family protein n=1 Tax=uncultured Roseobacter sp. TaxID=114847 RepID=UPI00261DA267|nr:DUF4387 family protein [uncultured Roseobacter sp.]